MPNYHVRYESFKERAKFRLEARNSCYPTTTTSTNEIHGILAESLEVFKNI